MMRRRWLTGFGLMLFVACPPWAAEQPRITALSDVLGIEAPDGNECPRTRVTGKGGSPQSLDQAVGNFNAALEGSVSPQAMRALEASPAWRDPALASRWAAAAIAADKPLAAAALAVRAHRVAPKEPLYLSNLAAVANVYGRHDEALAMVNAAEALAKDGAKGKTALSRANLLTNKANALIGLNRAPEAEAVLKEAIRLQPDLSEAYTNMAYALGHQNRCREAAKYLGAGGRRQPAEVLNPPKEQEPGKPPADSGRKESKEAQRAEEEEETFLPGNIAFDLSRGKRGLLPRVPIPTSLEEAAANLKLVEKFLGKLQQEIQSLMPGLQAAIDAEKRRVAAEQAMEDSDKLSAKFSADRSRRLRQALSRFARDGRTRDPHLDRFHKMMRDSLEDFRRANKKAGARAGEANNKALAKMVETENQKCAPLRQQEAEACGLRRPNCEALRGAAKACAEKAKWEWEQAQCKATDEYIRETAAAARAYDNWLRSYFHESYLYATAVASYLGHPDNKTWARFKLKAYEFDMFSKALGGQAGTATVTDDFLKMCKAPPPPPAPAEVPKNDVAFCVLPEGSKVKVGVKVVELAMNCEQVEVTLSTPGPLNLFVQVGYDKSERARKMADEQARKEERRANRNPSNPMGLREFGSKGPERTLDGELTVFIGSGVKTPSVPGAVPIEMEAKTGGFIKVGHYGGVVDFGTRSSSSTSVGIDAGVASVGVEMDAVEADVSFVSAPAPAR